MSRAFVKDDQDTERVLVPQRAPLPDGVQNLVTPAGLAALRRERASLEEESLRLQSAADDTPERSRRLAILHERRDDLEARLATAREVPPPTGATDVVRLGATVTARGDDGEVIRFRIVGVDEADALEGLVAFTAPTAAAVLERSVGDRVTVAAGGRDQRLEITGVAYDG